MNVARRYPRFRRLLASLAVSQAGDWLYNLALLAFVYERTHSSAWLGITTAARVLPIVVCGPLGGVIADRYDRRRIMIASDAIRLGLMLALAGVAAAGLPIVLAPVIAALSTAASSAYMPCVAATTPRLVDDADLPAANAARSAIGQVCIVAGPGFGALLLLIGPPSLAFALNGATFALSALAVASLPAGPLFAPAAEPDHAPNVLRELGEGARALLAPARRAPARRRRRHGQRRLRGRDRPAAHAQPRAGPGRSRLRLPAGELRPGRRARRRDRGPRRRERRRAHGPRRRPRRARRVHRAAGRPRRPRRGARARRRRRGRLDRRRGHGRHRPAARAARRTSSPAPTASPTRPRWPASSPARWSPRRSSRSSACAAPSWPSAPSSPSTRSPCCAAREPPTTAPAPAPAAA